MNKYPKICNIIKRTKNTTAKCKCGELGQYKVDIQYSHMRGDDVTSWSCKEHKNNVDFLALNVKEWRKKMGLHDNTQDNHR